MGFDLKVRRETTLPLAITIGEQVLNVRYRPVRVTPEDVRQLIDAEKAIAVQQAEKAKEESGGASSSKPMTLSAERMAELMTVLQDMVVSQVSEWDAVDGDAPIPLTIEGLTEAGFDLELMGEILKAIREDQKPPLESKKP